MYAKVISGVKYRLTENDTKPKKKIAPNVKPKNQLHHKIQHFIIILTELFYNSIPLLK